MRKLLYVMRRKYISLMKGRENMADIITQHLTELLCLKRVKGKLIGLKIYPEVKKRELC
ncbi:MAG: hypothetical protein JZD40_07360 [Sulfolobus sp.]|nr:hypothetical protein [Sulfolobus sp.]